MEGGSSDNLVIPMPIRFRCQRNRRTAHRVFAGNGLNAALKRCER